MSPTKPDCSPGWPRRWLLSREPEAAEPVLQFDGYRLDLAGHSLLDATGKEVKLTHGEFGLLRVFAQRPGRVLSRDQLLQLLSGRDAEAFDRSIDMQVVRLRRKIEPDPKRPSLIVTIPNSGYKFTAQVRQAEAAAPPEPKRRPRPRRAPSAPNDASSPLSLPKCSRPKGATCRAIRRSCAPSSMPIAAMPPPLSPSMAAC